MHDESFFRDELKGKINIAQIKLVSKKFKKPDIVSGIVKNFHIRQSSMEYISNQINKEVKQIYSDGIKG